ncbi:MAG: type II toxin-antitoxin system prevent-host-death family antitoxin [Egibacteraceae bacterium]
MLSSVSCPNAALLRARRLVSVLDQVARTKVPVLVTKHGKPVVRRPTTTAPATPRDERWEAEGSPGG